MAQKNFQIKLTAAILSVFAISVLLAAQQALARPTSAPPTASPIYPPGPRGATGPQGYQGSQGNQGSTGYQGGQGGQGSNGYTTCDWGGTLWISHGWDGAGAWGSGVYIYCSGGVVNYIQKQNGYWACTPRGCVGPP